MKRRLTRRGESSARVVSTRVLEVALSVAMVRAYLAVSAASPLRNLDLNTSTFQEVSGGFQ